MTQLLAEKPTDGLSKGMKQRLCLGQALIHDPSVLVLDEPAAGLDPRARIQLREMIRALADRGKTVLISSHILTELADLGLTDNTIVILTADHGELCGAHGMSGKGSTAFREQNNVPFMVYHPDMPGGRKCKAVTSHVDIIPTILAMTGADKHQKKEVVDKLHGHNVSPALEKPEKASYDAVREGALYCFGMWSFIDEGWLRDVAKLAFTKGKGITPVKDLPKPPPGKRSSIRTVFDGRYKYSRYFNNQEHNRPTTIEEIFKLNDVELFDLENDPYEMNNLALDKKNQDLLLAMNDKLNRLIDREVGKDDGSHLPDIDGISWTAKPFDAKDYFKTW